MTRVETRWQSWLTGLPIGSPRPPRPVVKPLEMPLLRAWIMPLALIFGTPVIALLIAVSVLHQKGEVSTSLFQVVLLPRPSVWALGVIAGWLSFQAVLLRWLPGRESLGPVTPAGERPAYRLNGMAAWAISHVAVLAAWFAGTFSATSFYRQYGELLVTLNVLALLFCVFLSWKGRYWPTGADTVLTGLWAFDFFQGPELHPRLFGVQLKQLINCRMSMMGWSVTWLVMLLAQYEQTGAASPGMVASTVVLVAYLAKFFWWEDGYFGSIDIIHDRFGYYIAWGVLVWVPAVYCLPAFWMVEHPSTLSAPAAGLVALLGLVSIAVNYAADAQRQRVRATDGQTTIWGRPPELIRAPWVSGDGVSRSSLLLVSGWWGISRHFNYVPELALAFAWTVPSGFTHVLPWFYWVFLLILLTDRARRDEKKCAAKYGDAWVEYCRRVRWRILPWVY